MYETVLNKVSTGSPAIADTRIYFDNAATTALDKEVLEAMLPYMTDHFGKQTLKTVYNESAPQLNVTPSTVSSRRFIIYAFSSFI